jgi:vacuolar protein sorting-associated protein 13A/C
VWSGDVVLHNLRLRKEALNQFKLPVEVKEGRTEARSFSKDIWAI